MRLPALSQLGPRKLLPRFMLSKQEKGGNCLGPKDLQTPKKELVPWFPPGDPKYTCAMHNFPSHQFCFQIIASRKSLAWKSKPKTNKQNQKNIAETEVLRGQEKLQLCFPGKQALRWS